MNAGSAGRVPHEALDPPDAQPRAPVGLKERAAGAAAEMHLEELTQIRREEHQPVLGPLAVADPDRALAELHVGDV